MNKAPVIESDRRLVSTFKAEKFKRECKKHWDLFYKRNENRFFKDRHWTFREFSQLLSRDKAVLFEIGCGVGNFVFPLIETEQFEGFIYACDFSASAIDIVRSHHLYNESVIKAFVGDITVAADDQAFSIVDKPVDIVSLIFVLSALPPKLFATSLKNVISLMVPGGIVLFRDYAINDMAMLRFGAGTKISDQSYLRQDGTLSYFFDLDEIRELFCQQVGFVVEQLIYVSRRTINRKEGIDVGRLFIQGIFRKPHV